MCSKVGIVVVELLSSLHSSHHCPAAAPATATASTAASALLSNSLLLPSAAAVGSSPLTSLQPHAEAFGSWSAAVAAAAAQFAGGAASGASFAARANAV